MTHSTRLPYIMSLCLIIAEPKLIIFFSGFWSIWVSLKGIHRYRF